jgi:hypothetical protein
MRANRISGRALRLAAVAAAVILLSSAFFRDPRRAIAAAPAPRESHQVAAIYFHRTKRCPTCKRISAYIEEAVKTRFTQQIKDRAVSMHLVDFQNPKNRKYTDCYKIARPTLVLVDIHGGKVTQWKPMPKVWSLVYNKEAFFRYVQDGIGGYLEGER